MSGPKTSNYTVDETQRRRLAENLKRERENLICSRLKVSIGEISRTITQKTLSIDGIISKINDSVKDGNLDPVDYSNVNRLLNEVRKYVAEHTTNLNNDIPVLETTKSKLQEMNNGLNNALSQLNIKFDGIKEINRNNMFNGLSNTNSSLFKNISNIKNEKSTSSIDSAQLSNKMLDDRRNEIIKIISKVSIPNYLEEKLDAINKELNEANDYTYLNNYMSTVITPFINECKKYGLLREKFGDEYDSLSIKVQTLEEQLGLEHTNVPLNEDSTQILAHKIEEYENILLKNAENAYISECIDEAMAEMNYKMAGDRSITTKRGTHFKSILYKYNDETAIDVTYSANGQITMELCGVSHNDNLPSDTESELMVDDMDSFCDDYKKILGKLRKKGIIPKEISHFPAEKQYAQFVNVNDYHMVEKMESYSSNRNFRKKHNTSHQQRVRSN